MTCREADARLADYLDDLLPPLARRRFAQHLGVCPACRRNALMYADTVELVRSAFVDPPPMAEVETRALLTVLSAATAH